MVLIHRSEDSWVILPITDDISSLARLQYGRTVIQVASQQEISEIHQGKLNKFSDQFDQAGSISHFIIIPGNNFDQFVFFSEYSGQTRIKYC